MQDWIGGDRSLKLSSEPAQEVVKRGEVHVWCLEPPREVDCPKVELFVRYTTQSERERALRYHFPADCWAYLTAQALLRRTLGNQLGQDPTEIRFRRNPYGRPFLEDDNSGLFFSLTHSRSLVAVAIFREPAIGIDTEQVGRPVNAEELAQSFFAATEVAHLRALPEGDRLLHFLLQWTVKESFLKAVGMGMHLPIDTLAIIPRQGTLETDFRHNFPERLSGWGFWATAGMRGHHLAVTVRSEFPEVVIHVGWAPQFWLTDQSAS